MLVLSRQENESILIGDNIEIEIVEIRGEKVRLGITAPKDIAVDRKEIREMKDDKFSDELRILRELGFRPFTLAMYKKEKIVEIIAYPYVSNNELLVNIRYEVGDPASIGDVLCRDVLTAQTVENKPEETATFIRLLAPFLTERKV